MATNWTTVAKAIEDRLKGVINYAKVTTVAGASAYLEGNVAQAVNEKDYMILISPPEGDAQAAEPMINGYFRKRFDFQIVLVAKTDPTAAGRQEGVQRKGVFEVQTEIVSALEHSNLGGIVDNKAGSNFEVGWSVSPVDGKGITTYATIYTVVKTEK